MADYLIMKAVEHDKLPVKFKKLYPTINALAAAGWWTQKKYDGCMGIAMMRFDLDACQMLSRTGEDYTPSCLHILKELHEAACEQSGSWNNFVVIGEVWLPINQAKFPAISGMFRRKAASKLRFMANDLLPADFTTTEAYRLRFADLCELLPKLDGDNEVGPEWFCEVVETHHTASDPMELALRWQGHGGYDGAIMRDPVAGYTVGTVKAGEIVKVKPVLSLDLKVTNQFREVGKKTGRDVYSIEVVYLGVHSRVGSGIPHSWDEVPPIHSIAEIECLGITEDGKLREPRFKGIRIDKVKPD